MTLINSLKLNSYKPTNHKNSFLKRRRKLIPKIDEQILLATDPNYKPTKIKWVRNEDGTERKLERPKRVRCWWTEQLGATILLTIRYGNKVLDNRSLSEPSEPSEPSEFSKTFLQSRNRWLASDSRSQCHSLSRTDSGLWKGLV